MSKVGVIIPVYGVEKYIERCARSLFEQTLDDIEFIFINDCTPDSSVEILMDVLEEYPNRFHQVKVVNMDHNSGQAAVRQKGIELATSDYVIHCDSDDYVDKDMYRLMYEKAVSGKYDIVVCDMLEGHGNEWTYRNGMSLESDDLVSDILMKILSSGCNKLVASSIAKMSGIVFPVENTCEDLALMVQYALEAKSIGYIDKPLYYYNRRPTSILGNRSPQSMLAKNRQMVANFDIAYAAMKRHKVENKYRKEILHIRMWIKNQLLPVMPDQNCTKLWRDTYREINPKVLWSTVFTLREKMNFVITYLGLYPAYCKFIKG